MTTLVRSAEAKPASRVKALWIAHGVSFQWLVVLLFAVLLVDWLTFTAGYAATDDPGTYTWQAWAVLEGKGLAHYTFWYDHPPVGWIQIAFYAWLTRGFDRAEIGILMASEFMVIMQLASCVLIFMFMRRLGFHRAFGALAVILFTFTPLGVQYQKLAFLDNIAVTWMLAAMVFAVSPRRSLASALGAGVCLAISVLSKETSAIWFVPVAYALWQNHSAKAYRRWVFVTFITSFALLGSFYVLYAFVKGEFFPGPGHVSLLDSLIWQLGRDIAFDALGLWSSFDVLLLIMTLVALPVAFVVRRLRPVAVGFTILAIMVIRGGYIPAPFIICILPFMALTVAGALGVLWPHREVVRGTLRGWANVSYMRYTRMVLVTLIVVAIAFITAPKWQEQIEIATPRDELVAYQQTLDYIVDNIPKDAVLAVDDNIWGDLVRKGYTNVVWFYKLDLDPAVQKQYVPNGYKGIDYVILKQIYTEIARDNAADPVVIQAMENGQHVARFGNLDPARGNIVNPYDVYKVVKSGNADEALKPGSTPNAAQVEK
jgi:hypothetical protein